MKAVRRAAGLIRPDLLPQLARAAQRVIVPPAAGSAHPRRREYRAPGLANERAPNVTKGDYFMHTSITTKRGYICATLLLTMPAISAAQSGAWSNIVEYTPPTPNAQADGITAGPDGNLWFTEFTGNNVGRITTAGVIAEYPLPRPNSGPFLITAGPDGALWFAEQNANQIGRITTAGSLTQYPVPTPASQPVGIAAGPDGAMWFTERSGNKIGRITTAGSVTEYPIPTPASGPYGIVAGPDGALWFSEFNDNKIGRITTAGVITQFATAPISSPQGITAGPDGALWFIGAYDNMVGRITTAGAITAYLVPNSNSGLVDITAGPDGALWFTEYAGGDIGRITTTGVITQFPVPTDGNPAWITPGPDGALWFTQQGGNKVSRAPACGLGFSASFAGSTLAMNFNLGTSTPATFDVVLINSTGPFAAPFSDAIPAIVPPTTFTMNWSPFPNLGTITVRPELGTGPGQGLCAEWTTVNTAQ